MNRVVVGISGGVDSAVACHLLQKQGYEVISVFLKLHSEGDEAAAAEIARFLGIEFFVLDKSAEFKKEVVDYFTETYIAGKTPNPCVKCNKSVKIKYLIEFADSIGCGKVATGHYARVGRTDKGFYTLNKGADPLKDQSYFLWQLSQNELSRLLFPLGELRKSEVKAVAAALGLSCAQAKESSEICFIKDDYVSYIINNVEKEKLCDALKPGDFVDADGKVLGKHKGYINYTIGQRRGLNISLGERAYVTGIDAKAGKVTVSSESDAFTELIRAQDASFVRPDLVIREGECYGVKVRYRSPEVNCTVVSDGGELLVRLREKVKMPAPAQSLVFYLDDEVVFGAIVE